jgi:glycerol-3-phosphate dehydrogenase (NAD(P)+)
MKCCVIGDGGWGTALAMQLERNGHEVTVWGPFEDNLNVIRETGVNSTYLPGVTVPPSLRWTTDHASAVAGTDLIVLVVPSRFFSSVVAAFKPFLPAKALIVSATKGFDETTYQRMTELAEAVLGRPVAALSGPSHAEEVACGVPTAVTVAHPDMAYAEKIQDIFMGDTFRVYTSADVIGVELGGALKNVVALAAGINDGMGLGDNSKAALMTRGLAEMVRLAVSLGADPETLYGLSGMGDLIVTCASKHSRNRSVGERLGKGESLADIMASMKMVAEGVWNCSAAKELADRQGVEVPITEQIYKVVQESKDPRQAVLDLMRRGAKPE